jgi:alpha-tubulin suppressor-like RCC1 family protein
MAFISVASSSAAAAGTVIAWGDDTREQTNVPPVANIIAVAGGYSYSLALKSDGTVTSWGYQAQTSVPGLSNITAITGGYSQNRALKNNGQVFDWTQGGSSSLVSGLSSVMGVARGGYLNDFSLALRSNGTVVGTNAPPSLTNAIAIAAGWYHTLALKSDGTVVGGGDDPYGQIDVPGGLSGVVAIAAGGYHSLALKSDGTVVAWGGNFDGQASVPPLSNVVAIAAGGLHSLALMGDGTVAAWGDNTYGQTSLPAGLTNVSAIACGGYHSLALIGGMTQAPLSNAHWSRTNGFTISVTTQSGRAYRMEYKNVISDSNWITQPLVAGTGGVLTFSDPTATTAPRRYYRIRHW